jgi:hypothetical protein
MSQELIGVVAMVMVMMVVIMMMEMIMIVIVVVTRIVMVIMIWVVMIVMLTMLMLIRAALFSSFAPLWLPLAILCLWSLSSLWLPFLLLSGYIYPCSLPDSALRSPGSQAIRNQVAPQCLPGFLIS